MKKKIKITLGLLLGVLLLLLIGFSYFIGSQVFAGSTQLTTNEETRGVSQSFWDTYGMDYDDFLATYHVEQVNLTSTFDNHQIPADYIYRAKVNGNKNYPTVILIHGLGGNRYTNYPIAAFFLELGYNVITYDQRSANENTAPYTTFGYWEKYDLMDWVDYVKKQAPGQVVGIWGTSFGGATAGLAIGDEKIDKKIDFLVLDCPVSSMKWMVQEEMRNMDTGIPISYMTLCGNIVNKQKLDFFYEDADVPTAIAAVTTPVLIINSKRDTVTPYFMGKDIYNAIKGKNKKLWTVEDSAHTEMWLDHNEEYRETVTNFIKNK